MTFEEFIILHHSKIRYALDVPQYVHLFRVRDILKSALETTQEHFEMHAEILAAAVSHDIFEDTTVSESSLAQYLSPLSISFVEGMTNTWGDIEKTKYIEKILASPEEVALIKCADLIDNCTSVIYTKPAHTDEWIQNFFLPIVQPMIRALINKQFHAYPLTGDLLKYQLTSINALLQKI